MYYEKRNEYVALKGCIMCNESIISKNYQNRLVMDPDTLEI